MYLNQKHIYVHVYVRNFYLFLRMFSTDFVTLLCKFYVLVFKMKLALEFFFNVPTQLMEFQSKMNTVYSIGAFF